CANGFSGLDSW
nr:immunoglobulin heavy chain junction region [Macaca mulatta]